MLDKYYIQGFQNFLMIMSDWFYSANVSLRREIHEKIEMD